jgi:metal-responsive CopG/Arc/MetJ family transcriptional regulator
MKMDVLIPEEVLDEAERCRSEIGTSRSQLYRRALREVMARHAPDRLTNAMNRVVDEVGGEVDDFGRKASRRLLQRVEW